MQLPEELLKNRPFIPNEMPQNGNKIFPAGEGIDFYVDGARFLPDNATVTKIKITAYTLDKE